MVAHGRKGASHVIGWEGGVPSMKGLYDHHAQRTAEGALLKAKGGSPHLVTSTIQIIENAPILLQCMTADS